MQNIEVKCDEFQINFHEYINSKNLVSPIFRGDGGSNKYTRGVKSEFVSVGHNYNLIYEIK